MSTPLGLAYAGAAMSPSLRFGALHHRDYRRYFTVALIGMTAESIEHVVSYWVIFESFHSPVLAGFAVISHWVPYLLFSVYAGALADRHDCRKLIQISQALFMLISLGWGALFLTGALRGWHASALLMLHGVAGVIASPSIQLIVHDVVGPDHLPSAIRLNAISRYLAMLLGPAVGGGLMLALGPGAAILVNVLLYVPLSVFLLRFPYTGHRRDGGVPRQTPRFSLAQTRQVLAEVRGEPAIIRMILLAGATSFFVGTAFQAQMPEFAHHHGSDDADMWYSVLFAANAVGAVIGATLMESVPAFRGGARAAIVAAGLWAAVMTLFPVVHGYAAAVTLLVPPASSTSPSVPWRRPSSRCWRPRAAAAASWASSTPPCSASARAAASPWASSARGSAWSARWRRARAVVLLVAIGLLVADLRAQPSAARERPVAG